MSVTETEAALPAVPQALPPPTTDVAADVSVLHRTVIEPTRGWLALNLREVWAYRDLFCMLVWRGVSANYRQSFIGIGWALIKPVVSMLIFTLIFGHVAKLPSDGVPYPIFSYTALLPWLYFAGCLTASTNSVAHSGALLTKVYFPRLILPLTGVATGLIDFLIQFAVLIVLMLWYGVALSWSMPLLPVLLLGCALAALAVGLWLTALNVKYRDIGHAVPFFTQAWMWITPVVYSSSMVPEKWRVVYGLNPMVGVIEGFRWAVLGKASPDWTMLGVSFAAVAVLLVSGLYYFRKMETTFADLI